MTNHEGKVNFRWQVKIKKKPKEHGEKEYLREISLYVPKKRTQAPKGLMICKNQEKKSNRYVYVSNAHLPEVKMEETEQKKQNIYWVCDSEKKYGINSSSTVSTPTSTKRVTYSDKIQTTTSNENNLEYEINIQDSLTHERAGKKGMSGYQNTSQGKILISNNTESNSQARLKKDGSTTESSAGKEKFSANNSPSQNAKFEYPINSENMKPNASIKSKNDGKNNPINSKDEGKIRPNDNESVTNLKSNSNSHGNNLYSTVSDSNNRSNAGLGKKSLASYINTSMDSSSDNESLYTGSDIEDSSSSDYQFHRDHVRQRQISERKTSVKDEYLAYNLFYKTINEKEREQAESLRREQKIIHAFNRNTRRFHFISPNEATSVRNRSNIPSRILWHPYSCCRQFLEREGLLEIDGRQRHPFFRDHDSQNNEDSSDMGDSQFRPGNNGNRHRYNHNTNQNINYRNRERTAHLRNNSFYMNIRNGLDTVENRARQIHETEPPNLSRLMPDSFTDSTDRELLTFFIAVIRQSFLPENSFHRELYIDLITHYILKDEIIFLTVDHQEFFKEILLAITRIFGSDEEGAVRLGLRVYAMIIKIKESQWDFATEDIRVLENIVGDLFIDISTTQPDVPRFNLLEFIKKYRSYYNSEGDCSICLQKLSFNQKVLVFRCNHVFHQSCVVPWIRGNHWCPTCRRTLENDC